MARHFGSKRVEMTFSLLIRLLRAPSIGADGHFSISRRRARLPDMPGQRRRFEPAYRPRRRAIRMPATGLLAMRGARRKPRLPDFSHKSGRAAGRLRHAFHYARPITADFLGLLTLADF